VFVRGADAGNCPLLPGWLCVGKKPVMAELAGRIVSKASVQRSGVGAGLFPSDFMIPSKGSLHF